MNLLRPYRLAARGARVYDDLPFARWETSTFIAALRRDQKRLTGIKVSAVGDNSTERRSVQVSCQTHRSSVWRDRPYRSRRRIKARRM